MRVDDPLAAFRFRLSLGDIEIAGFTECTGLEMETKVFEYKEGGLNTHTLKFPERAELKNLVLKRGLTTSYDLFDWYVDVANGAFRHANQRPPGPEDVDRKISIAIVDAGGEVSREWVLRRAFPVKWTGPELKSTDSSTCFETIELSHEGIEKLVS